MTSKIDYSLISSVRIRFRAVGIASSSQPCRTIIDFPDYFSYWEGREVRLNSDHALRLLFGNAWPYKDIAGRTIHGVRTQFRNSSISDARTDSHEQTPGKIGHHHTLGLLYLSNDFSRIPIIERAGQATR